MADFKLPFTCFQMLFNAFVLRRTCSYFHRQQIIINSIIIKAMKSTNLLVEFLNQLFYHDTAYPNSTTVEQCDNINS